MDSAAQRRSSLCARRRPRRDHRRRHAADAHAAPVAAEHPADPHGRPAVRRARPHGDRPVRAASTKGVRFGNGIVSDPLCCPSRATILTGTYSHTNGIYTNVNRRAGSSTSPTPQRSPRSCTAPGYDTGLIGKYLNGYIDANAAYIPPGWDRWFALTKLLYCEVLRLRPGSAGAVPRLPATTRPTSWDRRPWTSSSRRRPSKPLFLYWAPYAPHGKRPPGDEVQGSRSPESPSSARPRTTRPTCRTSPHTCRRSPLRRRRT